MLIQFLVENFLSFKNETVFSMLAPPEETRGVVEIPAHGLRLMRIASFYGANASGKSNLVKAIEVARRLIAYERSSDEKLPAHHFRLNSSTVSNSSRFQFDFIIEQVRYTYVLAFTRDTITAESLYRTLPSVPEEEMMYEREIAPNGGKHLVTFGRMFDSSSDDDRQFARFTARGAHARQPLLTKFATSNMAGYDLIRAWFQDGITIIGAQAKYFNLVRELSKNNSFRAFYGQMLAAIGTGIHEVQVEERRMLGQPSLFDLLPDLNIPQSHSPEPAIPVSWDDIGPESAFAIVRDDNEKTLLDLKFAHMSRNGFGAFFSFNEESDGTQRLLHLLPVLYHRTKDSGLCTIIDELDRSLHTTLTRHFVKEFLSMGSGTQTQLIFTTHDTNLLNGQLLPIPAIWFVEKDDDGASHIYSLAEYKPDQIEQLLEHLEEGYLQGRFGAIPFIADRNNLRWQVREEKPAQ